VDASGWVTEFIEKPKLPVGNLAFSGILLASREFVDFVPERRPVDIGFDVLPRMVGSLGAYQIQDYLIDIGTMENYRAAQQDWPGLKSSRVQEQNA
jgi:mannose-1-phosphate guanylyltransferase